MIIFIISLCGTSLVIAQEAITNTQGVALMTNKIKAKSNVFTEKNAFLAIERRIKEKNGLSAKEISNFSKILYSNKQFKSLAELYKNNQIAINSKGKHNYTMALFFLKTKQFSLFYKQTLLYLMNKNNFNNFRKKIILESIRVGNYKKIIHSIISSREYPKIDKLSYHLLIHCLLKEKKYKEAHKIIRNKIVSQQNPPIQEITLLMNLALKVKDGNEAAFWGDKIIANNKRHKTNAELLNNMAIAYLYQFKDNKDKNVLQQAISFHKQSLKLKRKFDIYHTGSLIYEATGNFDKAIKMINYCRALRPKNRAVITRYRLLQQKKRKGNK